MMHMGPDALWMPSERTAWREALAEWDKAVDGDSGDAEYEAGGGLAEVVRELIVAGPLMTQDRLVNRLARFDVRLTYGGVELSYRELASLLFGDLNWRQP